MWYTLIIIYLYLYLITEPKPWLRLYWFSSAYFLLGLILWKYPWTIQLVGHTYIVYLAIDTIFGLTDPSQLLSNGLSLIITTDTLFYSELPWGYEHVQRMGLILSLTSLTNFFLAVKQMLIRPDHYSAWIPKVSYSVGKLVYRLIFILVRIVLLTPMVLNSLEDGPIISQLVLLIGLLVNIYLTGNFIALNFQNVVLKCL